MFFLRNTPGENLSIFLNDQQITGKGGGDYENGISLLQSIPVANVALIRVYPPGTKITASGGSASGVIVIYTINKREARDDDNVINFDRIKKSDFSKVQQFAPADYDIRKNLQTPDDRITSYWNPKLTTDSMSHKASFSFSITTLQKVFI